jgi:hypothetical protein
MTRRIVSLWIAAVSLVAVSAPLFAHHSFEAEFDRSKQVSLTGTVTKVEWMNPHTYFYIDVKDPKTGKVQNWACEMGSPNGLTGRGWTRNTLRVGLVVTVPGSRAKDGSLKINAASVSLPDGRALNAASSGEQGYTGQ